MKKINVLMIEDSLYAVDLNIRELKKAYEEVHHLIIPNCRALEKAVAENQWDLILSEFSVPCCEAYQALQVIDGSHIPFVIVSESLSTEDKAKALKMGCSGFVAKDNLTQLRRLVPKLIRSR